MSLFFNTKKNVVLGSVLMGEVLLIQNWHIILISLLIPTIAGQLMSQTSAMVEDQYTAYRQLNMWCNWGMDVQWRRDMHTCHQQDSPWNQPDMEFVTIFYMPIHDLCITYHLQQHQANGKQPKSSMFWMIYWSPIYYHKNLSHDYPAISLMNSCYLP